MATETGTGEEMSAHLRSITVTAVASFGGIAAGLVSAIIATGPGDIVGLGVWAAFSLAELGVMRALGVDVEEFGAKDNLYVFFMTFSLWFITWGILLTSGNL
jgi:uncharacterized membrane protein